MKRFMVTFTTILFGITLIVAGVKGREWVLQPKTEFTYSVYAKDAAVDYGIRGVQADLVTDNPDELTQLYLVSIEQEMQEFADKYSGVFGVSNPQDLLQTIKGDHKKVRSVAYEDRLKVVFGWSIVDFYNTVQNEPTLLVHRGYLPFTPQIWAYIFIGVAILGIIIILQAILLALRLSGLLVPVGFKEAKARTKELIDRK